MGSVFISAIVSKIMNDLADISKTKIKKADQDRSNNNQNFQSRVYQVIIDALNQMTNKKYSGQERLYDAAERILKGFREGNSTHEMVRDGFNMLSCVGTNEYEEFINVLYQNICDEKNFGLYKEIILRYIILDDRLGQAEKEEKRELLAKAQKREDVNQILDHEIGKDQMSGIYKSDQDNVYPSDVKRQKNTPLDLLDEELKEYIFQKFERYKAQKVAVQTPQLLLMLLTYPGNNAIHIFNSYKMSNGDKYGEYLINFFREIDVRYKSEGRSYREKNWTAFLMILDKAEETFYNQKYEDSITASLLCYALLNYSCGTTIDMIRCQMGNKNFEQIKNFLLKDTIPSLLI